jgi:small-conductance mechanosensitive channel
LPDVLFLGFGDSSLNFELRVWTIRQVQTPKILASDLYFAIFDSFQKHGIEIPFPQRDLHIKSLPVPVQVSGI